MKREKLSLVSHTKEAFYVRGMIFQDASFGLALVLKLKTKEPALLFPHLRCLVEKELIYEREVTKFNCLLDDKDFLSRPS